MAPVQHSTWPSLNRTLTCAQSSKPNPLPEYSRLILHHRFSFEGTSNVSEFSTPGTATCLNKPHPQQIQKYGSRKGVLYLSLPFLSQGCDTHAIQQVSFLPTPQLSVPISLLFLDMGVQTFIEILWVRYGLELRTSNLSERYSSA